MATSLENQIDILATFWLDYKDDPRFEDFIEINDLGLALAHLLHEGIIEITEKASNLIRESFSLLLTRLEQSDNKGFETLDDIFFEAGYKFGI